jgi:hypothetical protein
MSGVALVWTLAYAAALLYFVLGVAASLSAGTPLVLFDVAGSVLLSILLVYGWLRAVAAYEITGENLVVKRNGPGTILIPLDKIASAEPRPSIGNFFNMRLFGLGGLFGWAGRARVRNPTDLHSLEAEVYGTNPKNSVLLGLESGANIIVTPDDPGAFLTTLEGAGVLAPAPRALARARKGKRR